jgi:protein TonB
MQFAKRATQLIATLIVVAGANATANEVPASLDAKACKVSYPKQSLMNEEQGVTSMQFLVSAGGKVLDSKLEKSSGFKSLDKAALSALAACQFKPGTKDGAPSQTWTKIDYAWAL